MEIDSLFGLPWISLMIPSDAAGVKGLANRLVNWTKAPESSAEEGSEVGVKDVFIVIDDDNKEVSPFCDRSGFSFSASRQRLVVISNDRW